MQSRSLAVLIAVGACIPLAQAQSSSSNVQLFGVIDAGYTHFSASGAGSLNQISTDGNNSSRWGVRGTEDLGDGLKASFWLEGAFNPDTGTSGATSSNNIDSVSGALFGRRSTVSLAGTWGELRLGRYFTPSFNNLAAENHPFGTNGVGSSASLFYPVNTGGTTVRTHIRASNAVGYFLPDNLGGFYGEAMYALGEQPSMPSATKDNGKYFGVRVGYRAGDLNIALASGKTQYATGDYTQSNIAVNYVWGPVKLMYLWGENKVGVTKTTINMIGTQWKLGPGQLRAAYTTLDAKKVANDADEIAIGYVYDLSRRTALYTSYAQVKNKNSGKTFNLGLAPTAAGGKSKGLEFGLRHSF